MKTVIPTQPLSLTRGGALFLEHALTLLSEEAGRAHPSDPFREPIEVGIARASAVLQLAAGEISDLTPGERSALADALRVAADLAAAARIDPRWDRLDLPGDPVLELRDLRDQVQHLALVGSGTVSRAA
jgi:hypothetical protein